MKIKTGTLPWTKSCFVCGEANPHGLRLRSRVEEGIVVIDYVAREADGGYHHMVHGGIAITLLDEVMTWAAILSFRKICVAAELSARLIHPIQVGEHLRVEGRVSKASSRLCLTEGFIKDREGKVLMIATGKFMPMRADKAKLTEEDFIISPEAIHPKDILES